MRGGDAGAIIDLIIEQARLSQLLRLRPVSSLTSVLVSIQGYEISAAESFNLDLSAAKEFLEVYKGTMGACGAFPFIDASADFFWVLRYVV